MVGHSLPWKKRETARVDMMKPKGCIRCWLIRGVRTAYVVIHHLIRGNKRMGHWYTLPLCEGCHAAAHNGAFPHHEQIAMWQTVQVLLGLDATLPASKIFPRKTP